ncbi:ABCB1 [Mytilus coruscus]|uniref:ABCB1 n=1 Tax=Mytilus coruscus TaxID=42192 RepID=A0A6J7ZW45_MYTCO|nr:ABCB1 [Mytilus coruscus]
MSESEERKPLLADEQESYTDDKKTKDEEKKKPEGPPPATLGQLFRYATSVDTICILFGSLFSLAHGAGWPVLSIVMGQMTDTFVAGPNGSLIPPHPNATFNPNATVESFEDKMTTYAIYYLIIGGAVLFSGYLQIACFMTACERQVNKIRKHFFRAILRQEIGWFDKHQSGELTTRLSDDLERVREGIGDKLSLLIQFTAQFFAGFAIGFWKSWKMTLVMMSLTPVLAILAAYFSSLMQNFAKREQALYADAGSVAEEVISCMRTVVSFNGQKQEVKRYGKSLEETKQIGIKKSMVTGLLLGSLYLVMFGDYALSFWYGNEQVKDYITSMGAEGITPGTVLTVFFCVMIGSFSIGNAAPNIGSFVTAKGAAAVVYEIIDREPKIDASSEKGQRPLSIQGALEFFGVNFTYPTREDVQVLTNFNLSIKPGQTVALVGSSGCGKSTIVNLIQRFYDPDAGQVLLDGNNIKDLNLNWLRQNIGVVSQEPVLFGCTIAENIRLGNPNATITEIEQAAKQANAHDFIKSLPQSYNTLVGERGAQLSGGQKQRVAIARALIRDPRILLLDEATSALDSESENIVQEALEKARQGRTTLVIAHRLSTIQKADIIYVVDKGEIIEQGTHGDLMDKQGLYHSLVTAQTLVDEDTVEFALEEEEEEEAVDAVPDQTVKRPRSRIKSTSSNDKSPQKLSRQMSRQLSRQMSGQPEGKDKADKEEEPEEQEEYEPPKYFRMIRENQPECGFIVLGIMSSCVAGCTMPAFAIFFGEMIKVFIELGNNGLLWSMMFLALGGINFLVYFVQASSFGISGERLTQRLRLGTFNAYMRQDIAFFDDKFHSTGALTTRLATDASLVKTVSSFHSTGALTTRLATDASLVKTVSSFHSTGALTTRLATDASLVKTVSSFHSTGALTTRLATDAFLVKTGSSFHSTGALTTRLATDAFLVKTGSSFHSTGALTTRLATDAFLVKTGSSFHSTGALTTRLATDAFLVKTVSSFHSTGSLTTRLATDASLVKTVSSFHSTGALTTRLATDASLVKTATGVRIGMVFQSLFGLVAALVIAFYYGWALALVVLGIVPVIGFASSLQIKVLKGRHEEDKSKLEDAGKTAAETIENIRTVQSLTTEKHFYNEYSHSLVGPLRSMIKQAHWYGIAFGLGQGVIFMTYAGAFRFGAWQVEIGEMTADNVFKVFFAIAFTAMVIGQSSSFLPEYSKAKHAAGLIFKAFDTIPPIDIYSKRGTYLQKVDGLIQFKEVNFCYPTRPEVKVLKGVNMKVDPGQTVALVGQSGCGKSTVISLLQRFYDPESGEIMIDGIDIKELHLHKMRSFISVVSQEPILFNCSIRDNIAYGLEETAGMDDIITAARDANIHEFITSQPMGYDTVVGEKGTQLSGGQKQRVAIARALIRNPKILLLDEATSALDSESEKLVQEALDKAQEGRTCIVIAHRLSTIQNADVIFVMDNGAIVESGTHQTLLAKKGVYNSLVSAQQFIK